MNRDEILSIYDPWYADTYDERFHGGDAWNANLGAYKVEVVGELLRPGGRWLDVGCGTGKHLAAHPEAERAGLDISPSMVEQARKANPGVTITEGSYLDDHPEWVGAWDLVTNLWLSYQFVDSLKLLEQAVANMASWVAPDGCFFMHIADCEDVARGTILPWEDPTTPVFGDSLFVTSVTWTWRESNGRTHHDLVAPQLQRMVNIVARDFEEVEVRRWPAIDLVSGRPKGIIGRRKRATPLTLAEVGWSYPYTLVYPPPDHPAEHDPARPGDETVPVEATPAPELERLGSEVQALRSELASLADALVPPPDSDRYDTLGVVHDQVWAVRKDLAGLYHAWEARSAPPPVGAIPTRRLLGELGRRFNPLRRQTWRRLRRAVS